MTIGPDRYSPTMTAVDVWRMSQFGVVRRGAEAPVPASPRRSPGARHLDEVTTRLAPMAYAGGADERDAANDPSKESKESESKNPSAKDP